MKKHLLIFLFLLGLVASPYAGAKEASITFSQQGFANAAELSTISLNEGDISLSFAAGSSSNKPKYYTTGNAARLYGGNTMTVTSKKGNIEKIAFTVTSSNQFNSASTASTGNFSTSGTTPSWTGNASSVTFTQGGTSGHVRITKMTITYSVEGGGSTTDPTLGTYTQLNDVTLAVGESFTAPKQDGKDAPAISYASDNACVTVNGSTITAVQAGTANITASWAADANWAAGSANFAVTVTGGGNVDPDPSTGNLLDLAFAKHATEYKGWGNSYSNTATIQNETASITLSSFSKQTTTLTDYPVTKAGAAILSVLDQKNTFTSISVIAKQWGTKAATFKIYTSEDGKTYSSNAVATCNNFELKSTALEGNVKYVKIQFSGSNQIGLCSVSYTLGEEEIVQETYVLPQGAMTMAIGDTKKIDLGSKFPTINFVAPENGIVSVDDQGNVKALKGGNGKIVLNWEETDRWVGGTAEIEVTVARKNYTQNFSDIVMRVGETFVVKLGNEHPDVKLVSDNAAVTVADGTLTAVSAGAAKITASWIENDMWNGGEKSFNVTVKEAVKPSNIGFQHEQVNGIVGHPVAWQAADASGDGKLNYSVSPTGIVKIDPATGALTALSKGTATVTATIGATDNYNSATATYTVVITENPAAQPASGETTTFNFAESNAYNLYPYDNNTIGGSQGNYGKMEKDRPTGTPVTSITENGVTIAFEGDYRLFFKGSDGKGNPYDLRLYNNSTYFTISAGGSKIKSVTFRGETYVNLNCYSAENPETFDNPRKTKYTILEENQGEDVCFYVNGSANIGYIDVELEGGATGKKAPELVFDNEEYSNFLADEAAMTFGVSHAAGIDESLITYSIDNLPADDYIAEADGEGLVELLVSTPGVWTLRADYPGDATTVAGSAVMRLNVFPRIAVDGDNKFHADENYVVLEAAGGNVSVGHDHGNVFHCYTLNEKFLGKYETALMEDVTYDVDLKYGDIDEFSNKQTVHAIIRPAKPTSDFASAIISSTVGTTLYWREAPAAAVQKAPRATSLIDLAGWEDLGSNSHDFAAISQNPDFKNKVLEVVAVKDASDRVAGLKVPSEILPFAFTADGNITGIENVEIDANAGEVEFFNLQGVRVANPENGLYIRRQGTKVEKVLVK